MSSDEEDEPFAWYSNFFSSRICLRRALDYAIDRVHVENAQSGGNSPTGTIEPTSDLSPLLISLVLIQLLISYFCSLSAESLYHDSSDEKEGVDSQDGEDEHGEVSAFFTPPLPTPISISHTSPLLLSILLYPSTSLFQSSYSSS
jgi:hypothetical protein